MENLNVNLEDSTKELIVRQGQAEPAKQPRKSVNVNGTIGIVVERLKNLPKEVVKHTNEFEDTKLANSHVLADLENGTLELIEDAGMENSNSYKGKLSLNPDFEKFGINSGKYRTTHELADFINMNRSFFEGREIAMVLIAKLRNFEAKVNSDIESKDDLRGNSRSLRAQAVESNIPADFTLNIPLFKGGEAENFKVEIIINPNDLTCALMSPESEELIYSLKRQAISSEIAQIKELHNKLSIFYI